MKLNKNQRNWLSIVGLVALAYGYWRLIKPPKAEKKSNFNPLTLGVFSDLGVQNIGSRDRVMFTLTNNTKTPQKVDLFDSYSLKTFAQQNPSVSVSSVPSVDFFSQSLNQNPIPLSHLEVRSSNRQQINQMIRVVAQDASGQMAAKDVYPIVSAYQAQGDIATADLQGMILSGRSKIDDYTIFPNTTVMLTFYFAEPLGENPRAGK